ncbi:unnamed protein product, partial [Meganyctiphanes norvegica]
VYVNISDVNDHVPQSSLPVYRVEVLENSPAGTTVLAAINASDPDPDTVISYHITDGNNDDMFTIEKSSGEIKTKNSHLDREIESKYELEITLKDAEDDSALTSKTFVIINIIDENDNAPQFLDRIYKF